MAIKRNRWIPFACAAIAFALCAPVTWAQEGEDEDEDEEEIAFEDAFIFFELNDTDGDLGIHALIDGDPWKRLTIEGPEPEERKLLKVRTRSSLRMQGLTEFFFESAEPKFESDDPDEPTLSPEEFFARFPEGIYEIEGRTLEGEEIESESEVTHTMPGPPDTIVTEYDDATPLECFPEDAEDLVIRWDPVTMSHPDLGNTGVPIEVHNYQVVVEAGDAEASMIFPPDICNGTCMVAVPEEVLPFVEDEFKWEVLVREASYNQTASEVVLEICGAEEEEEE